ncbi:MAG: hypothetical protein WCO13_00690 [Bacteroidota bacterium]
MIKGIKNVIELLEENRCPYWFIAAAPKEPAKSQDESTGLEENFTFLQSLPHLQKSLERLEAGKYYISFWDNPKSKNTRFGEWFLIESQAGTSSSILGIASTSPEDLDAKINRAVDAARERWETSELIKRNEKEIAEHKASILVLNKELKTAQDERQDVWTSIAEKISPFLSGILPAILPASMQTAAVAGTSIHLDDSPADTAENLDRLQNALNVWTESESIESIIALIEKIAVLAKDNKSLYEMAKTMLNK